MARSSVRLRLSARVPVDWVCVGAISVDNGGRKREKVAAFVAAFFVTFAGPFPAPFVVGIGGRRTVAVIRPIPRLYTLYFLGPDAALPDGVGAVLGPGSGCSSSIASCGDDPPTSSLSFWMMLCRASFLLRRSYTSDAGISRFRLHLTFFTTHHRQPCRPLSQMQSS